MSRTGVDTQHLSAHAADRVGLASHLPCRRGWPGRPAAGGLACQIPGAVRATQNLTSGDPHNGRDRADTSTGRRPWSPQQGSPTLDRVY